MFKQKNCFIYFVCFTYFLVSGFSYSASNNSPITELTVTGVSIIGSDQDNVYQNAVYDGFQKAYAQIQQNSKQNSSLNSKNSDSKKDLITVQQELGITEYKVLRYWRDQDKFYVELHVSFGVPKIDQPRICKLPKMDWVYQTDNQISMVSPSTSFLAVWTPQTIEVLDPENGKRKQWIKMGLVPHSICGELYLVQDNDYLKLSTFKKFNAYNLLSYSVVYKWRVKLPNIYRFDLSDAAVYTIDRSGLITAYELEKGKKRWQIQANSQTELNQLSYKNLLMILPNNELWMVNENGDKLWLKKFEKGLAGKPILFENELMLLFKDGQLLILNPDTGQEISRLSITFHGTPQHTNLMVNNQKLVIFYNDLSGKGHLQVFQKFTGTLIWENNWEESIADSIVIQPDLIIIGVKNALEARDPLWGMKLWEENMNGIAKQLTWGNDRLYVVINDKVLSYQLK